jgi:4-amino-4-deoxy-L-arabinose transferase-like glycosyltransferase
MAFNAFSNVAKWLVGLAIASFFISLGFPYVGEEGVYTISSYEMWYYGHFFYPTLFGVPYWRPPLFNWLIIPFAAYFTWNHVLVVARFVTASATIASFFMLLWLSKHLFKNTQFGLFAGLIFLTSDALFYHGWIAYADPLFAFFSSSAIIFLWLANLEERYGLVWLAAFCLIAAFLTKALTAYIFYMLSLGVIIIHKRNKAFILQPHCILPQLLAFGFPVLWDSIVHGITGRAMLGDIFHKFDHVSVFGYVQQLFMFPLELGCRFLPASLLAVFYYLKKEMQAISFNLKNLNTLTGIILFNFIPYWLGPHTGIRYVLPLYPFLALFIAVILWHLPKVAFSKVIIWLALTVVAKNIGLIFFYYYQQHYRGDYSQVAKQIMQEAGRFALYTNNDVAMGLSVTAIIDNLRYPAPPLRRPLFASEQSYFIISDKADPQLGQPYRIFAVGKQKSLIYLLCKGSACDH